MTRGFAPGAATWSTYDGAHPWTTAGGDYNASPHTVQTVSPSLDGTTVSLGIPDLVQPWVNGSTPFGQLEIVGFQSGAAVFTFFNRASGNGPVLSVTYTPPSPPTTTTGTGTGTGTSPTTTTGPVVTTPVPTPLPISHAPRALRVKVVLSWTWNGTRIRLRKVKVGTMPGDTKLVTSCSGHGCPHHSKAKLAGARKVRRALLKMAGRRYRAGDVLSVKLTAAGWRQERARIFFRNGKRPLILG
jgi:hypothetical protein